MTRLGIPLLLLLLLSACNSSNNGLGFPSSSVTTVHAASTHSLSKAEKQLRQFDLDIRHYLNSYNQQHWDEVLNVTYMPMYGKKNRDEVMTDFVKAKMTGFQRTVDLKKIEKVSKVVTDGKNNYAKIFIASAVKVKLSGQALEQKDHVKMNLELSYDTNDVSYQESTQELVIADAYTAIIAISKKGSNLWKYVEVDKQKEPLLAQIIPEKVLDQLDN